MTGLQQTVFAGVIAMIGVLVTLIITNTLLLKILEQLKTANFLLHAKISSRDADGAKHPDRH